MLLHMLPLLSLCCFCNLISLLISWALVINGAIKLYRKSWPPPFCSVFLLKTARQQMFLNMLNIFKIKKNPYASSKLVWFEKNFFENDWFYFFFHYQIIAVKNVWEIYMLTLHTLNSLSSFLLVDILHFSQPALFFLKKIMFFFFFAVN